jgi:Sulfotransferase domain
MQVIGAGFGRTGTLSLKAALEQLGCGPCFHMLDLIQHPERAPEWRAAARGEPVEWGRVFDGYEATVDWPGATFSRELAAHWPDAKVLLTVRDPGRWYDSVMNTIHAVREAARRHRLDAQEAAVEPRPEVFAVIDDLIWDGTFGGRAEDRDHAIAVFERHNAQVRATIPADRLLVHEIQDGWEPLADFLGTPVPDAPFPRLNDTDAFRSMVGMPALART